MAEVRSMRRGYDSERVKEQVGKYDQEIVEAHDGGWSALDMLAQDVERELIDWAARRTLAEERWIADAEQYAGLNDPITQSRLNKNPNRSQAFLNLTREKTKVLDARLNDALMPTDTPTWSLKPTPVPSLSKEVVQEVLHDLEREWIDGLAAERERETAAQQAEQQAAAEAGAGQPPVADPSMAEQGGEVAPSLPPTAAESPAPPPLPEPTPDGREVPRGRLTELREGLGDQRVADAFYERAVEMSDGMRRLMHDQLVEGEYAKVVSGVTYDATKFGVGIVEGPVADWRAQARWGRKGKGDKAVWVQELDKEDERPIYENVRPWDFFGDPDAVCVDDMSAAARLYRLSAPALRRMGRAKGFNMTALRHLLREKPRNQLIYSDFIASVRSFEIGNADRSENRYYVFKWSGYLEAERFQTIAESLGGDGEELVKAVRAAGKTALGDDYGDDEDGMLDPAYAPRVTLWLCEGVGLKLELHPLESGESLFSVFTLVPQESNLYGDGVPALIEQPQRWVNACARLMIDNAKRASLPAMVKSSDLVRADGGPANVIEEDSVWQVADENPERPTTGIFPTIVPLTTQPLIEMMGVAREFIDSESLVPRLTHGESSQGPATTAHGMTLMANAINVQFRNMVRNFDLTITRPVLKRLYEWNMLREGNDHLKGDMSPDITGTSALLVRDVQAGNLMMAIQMVAQNPNIEDAVKLYPLLKAWIHVSQLNPEETLYTVREFMKNRMERQQREQEMAEAQGGDDNIKIELERLRQEGVSGVEQLRQQTQREQMQSSERQAQEKNRVAMETAAMKIQAEQRQARIEAGLKAAYGTGI